MRHENVQPKVEEEKVPAITPAVTPSPEVQPGTFEERFGEQQLTTTFQALAPAQQQQFVGGFAGFREAVEAERGRIPGLTQEAAIGTVVAAAPVRLPVPVQVTDIAAEEVRRMEAEIEERRRRVGEFVPEIPPPPAEIPQLEKEQQVLQQQLQEVSTAVDTAFGQIFTDLEQRKATLDVRTQETVTRIQGIFARRRDQLNITNANRLRGLEIAGIRTGRQRFAPEIQSGILSAEEKAGIQRLTELDVEEEQLILQAEQANEDNQLVLLFRRFELASQKRREKVDLINNLFEMSRRAEERAIEQARFGMEAIEFSRQTFFDEFALVPEIFLNKSIEEKQFIEADLGFEPGFIDAYGEAQLITRERSVLDQSLEETKQLVDILAKVPQGQEITIGDKVFSGFKSIDPNVIFKTETDNKGNVTAIIFDQDTQTIEKRPLGKIGKKSDTSKELQRTFILSKKELNERAFTPLSSDNFNRFMDALGGQESGMNYNALNDRTGAFGKFQVLPENWVNWSREYAQAVGEAEDTYRDENNPANQEAVVRFKLEQVFASFNNWADVASWWYSGKPFSQVESEGWADNPQGAGNEPSVREYVNSVLTRFVPSTEEIFKFSSSDKNKLIGRGLGIADVVNIENRLNDDESLDDILADSELTISQVTGIREVLGKKEEVPKAPTQAEREAIALSLLQEEFEEKIFGFRRLDEKGDIIKKAISDAELARILVLETGIKLDRAEKLVTQFKKG